MALVTQGFKNQEIAEKLSIAEQTVKNYLHSIFYKLSVTDRFEMALYAVSIGIHLSPQATRCHRQTPAA